MQRSFLSVSALVGFSALCLLTLAPVRAQNKAAKAVTSHAGANLQSLLPEVIRHTQAMTDTRMKSAVLEEIAKAQAQTGDVIGAKQTAAGITDAASKVSALIKIAGTQALSGDVADAIKTFRSAMQAAEGIKSENSKGYALINIAQSLGNATGKKNIFDCLAHLPCSNIVFKEIECSEIA